MQDLDYIKRNYLDALEAMNTSAPIEIRKELGPEEEFICESESLRQVIHEILNAANTDSPILLQGESGSGKDVLANYIHILS